LVHVQSLVESFNSFESDVTESSTSSISEGDLNGDDFTSLIEVFLQVLVLGTEA